MMGNKITVEGHPTYDNDANGYYREWAYICDGKDCYSLLDIFHKTALSEVDETDDWKKCRVRVTVEILSLP